MPNGVVLQDEWHLLIVDKPSSALSDCSRLTQFTSDDIKNAVDELTAFRGTVILCKLNVFVDGYLHRNVGEGNDLRDGHLQDDLVGKGKAVNLPVPRIVGDQAGVWFRKIQGFIVQPLHKIFVFLPVK